MGTASVAADFFRSPELKAPSGAREIARNSDNRFNDYLEEARSAKPKRETERAEDTRKAREADARDAEATGDEITSTDDVQEVATDDATAANAVTSTSIAALPAIITTNDSESAQVASSVDGRAQAVTALSGGTQQTDSSDTSASQDTTRSADQQRGPVQPTDQFAQQVSANDAARQLPATSVESTAATAGSNIATDSAQESKLSNQNAAQTQSATRMTPTHRQGPNLPVRKATKQH